MSSIGGLPVIGNRFGWGRLLDTKNKCSIGDSCGLPNSWLNAVNLPDLLKGSGVGAVGASWMLCGN